MNNNELKMKDRIESERKFWNSFAGRYDAFMNRNASGTYTIILEILKEDIRNTANLLELAAGTGTLSVSLSSIVPHITAVDISPEMIKVAKLKAEQNSIKNITFRVGDLCDLEFSDKTFEIIVASNVLHLLFEPQLALSEMRRVLTDNGKIIIPTYMHGENMKSRLLSLLMSLFGFRAMNKWNSKDFKKFIESNGFSITKSIVIQDKIPLVYIVAE